VIFEYFLDKNSGFDVSCETFTLFCFKFFKFCAQNPSFWLIFVAFFAKNETIVYGNCFKDGFRGAEKTFI